jgi:hypothetical protein
LSEWWQEQPGKIFIGAKWVYQCDKWGHMESCESICKLKERFYLYKTAGSIKY